MKIYPAASLKRLFLEKLKEKNSNPRPNIHVSDLVYCLRGAYFQKVNPRPPSPRILSFFVDGSRRHIALQALSGMLSEVRVEKYGVIGHIDMLKDEGVPIEFKSTRAPKNIPANYFLQLSFYCIMLDVNHGYLIIQRLMRKDEDPWEVYRVQWTREEMINLDYELYSRAELLRRALENRDPSILPKVESNMKWKCRNCRYKDMCNNV